MKYLITDTISRVTGRIYGLAGDPVSVINERGHVFIVQHEQTKLKFPVLKDNLRDDKDDDNTCDKRRMDGGTPKTQRARPKSAERVVQSNVPETVSPDQISLW